MFWAPSVAFLFIFQNVVLILCFLDRNCCGFYLLSKMSHSFLCFFGTQTAAVFIYFPKCRTLFYVFLDTNCCGFYLLSKLSHSFLCPFWGHKMTRFFFIFQNVALFKMSRFIYFNIYSRAKCRFASAMHTSCHEWLWIVFFYLSPNLIIW